jgi:hypothetical protein
MTLQLPKTSRFKKITEPLHRNRVVTIVESLQKHGKTHFSLTAPSPILYQDIDNGLEDVADKFLGDKEIWPASYKTSKADSNAGEQQAFAAGEVKAFLDDFYGGLKSGARTIVWDTASELWEMMQLAEFGKLTQNNKYGYRGINSMMRDMIRAALDSDTNLIMLHRLKQEYKDDKWTGEYTRAGYSGAGYEAQLILRSVRCKGDCGSESHPEGNSSFHLKVIDSRANPDMNGYDFLQHESPDNSFKSVMAAIYSTPEEDWE